jgi:hypothetical protein
MVKESLDTTGKALLQNVSDRSVPIKLSLILRVLVLT